MRLNEEHGLCRDCKAGTMSGRNACCREALGRNDAALVSERHNAE
jgi:hypothetical protein